MSEALGYYIPSMLVISAVLIVMLLTAFKRATRLISTAGMSLVLLIPVPSGVTLLLIGVALLLSLCLHHIRDRRFIH